MEPIIDKYILFDTLYAPEPEPIYIKNWIKPEDFKYYNKYSNILIIGIDDPIDDSIDTLIKYFRNKHDVKEFPIILNDVYAKPQIITLIRDSDKNEIEKKIDHTSSNIKEIIDNHLSDLLLYRSEKQIQNKSLSSLIYEKFSIDMFLSENFKLINNPKDSFIWLGKGSIGVDNSSYQWIVIHQDNMGANSIDGPISLLSRIKEVFNSILPDIKLITKFNKYSKINFNNKNIYKVNSNYNHLVYQTCGPLTIYLIEDFNSNKITVIFALVNAPGQPKIQYIKELETIIINSIF